VVWQLESDIKVIKVLITSNKENFEFEILL